MKTLHNIDFVLVLSYSLLWCFGSIGLLIRRPQVRVLPGVPDFKRLVAKAKRVLCWQAK